MPASRTCSWWRRGRKNLAANKFSAAVRRLKAVATKEVRQLSRDRVTFGMIVGVPLMQIILFGYAINYDVRNLATVVQDDANSSMSREFIAQLKATQVVHVTLHHQLLGRARATDARRPRQHGGGDPAGFRAPPAGRHAPGGADPGRWIATPTRRGGRRHRGGAPAHAPRRRPVFGRQTHGAAAHRDPHALQPGEAHRGADRAGAHRRDPDDDHGAVHLGRHRARTRARQPGIADRHAAQQPRAHGGQTTALRCHRPHPDDDHPDRRRLAVQRPGRRKARGSVRRGADVHRGHAGPRASSSPRWRRRSSRHSSSRSSRCCRRSCCPGSCFRSKACPWRRSGSPRCCRSRISM